MSKILDLEIARLEVRRRIDISLLMVEWDRPCFFRFST